MSGDGTTGTNWQLRMTGQVQESLKHKLAGRAAADAIREARLAIDGT